MGPLKGAPDWNHFLHKKIFLVISATWKIISKITKPTNFLERKGSQTPRKRCNVTLIYPMSCKSQSFIDEVLQCLIDKYQITYQNIWGKGVVRPHLVELGHYNILEPLKGSLDLKHFLHKKRLLVIATTWKRILKITKLTKTFWGKGQWDSPHPLQTPNFYRWILTMRVW